MNSFHFITNVYLIRIFINRFNRSRFPVTLYNIFSGSFYLFDIPIHRKSGIISLLQCCFHFIIVFHV